MSFRKNGPLRQHLAVMTFIAIEQVVGTLLEPNSLWSKAYGSDFIYNQNLTQFPRR